MLNTRHLLVLGIAGVLGLAATSQSMAGPVIGGSAAVKAAAAGDTINVQWRRWGGGWRGGWRRGWGWGPGLGVGLGLGLAGAAAAGPYYGGYGCGPYGACGGYGYGYDAYAPAVAVVPGPVLVDPGYGYGGPWGWRRGWGGSIDCATFLRLTDSRPPRFRIDAAFDNLRAEIPWIGGPLIFAAAQRYGQGIDYSVWRFVLNKISRFARDRPQYKPRSRPALRNGSGLAQDVAKLPINGARQNTCARAEITEPAAPSAA